MTVWTGTHADHKWLQDYIGRDGLQRKKQSIDEDWNAKKREWARMAAMFSKLK